MSELTNGLPKLTGRLSMTKLKNRLKKIDPSLVTKLKNSRVNGELIGCTGFVTDPRTGAVVYLCAEAPRWDCDREAYLRWATSTTDFRGGLNHFLDPGEDLASAVVELLGQNRYE